MSAEGLIHPVVTEVKPRLRGWLHAAAVPCCLVGGILLVLLAGSTAGRVGGAVYLAASVMLFGTSALYHRGRWSPRAEAVLRRLDHSNLVVFIAATYTPLALLLLTGTDRVVCLSVVWGVAVAGVCFRVFWLGAPRWLYVLLYLGLGWVAVFWLPQLWAAGGPLVMALIITGGLVYSLGAIVYARKRPNPSPRWFGFHEVFHLCTVLAAGSQFAAITLITV